MIQVLKNSGYAVFVLLVSTTLQASGAFVLKGHIKSFNEKEYQIATNRLSYRIKKESLTPEQVTLLKEKKVGDNIELALTTDVIEDVSEDKTAAKGPSAK